MIVNKIYSSPNFSIRSREIDLIIIHYTEMPFEEAIAKLCDVKAKVSSHYLIKSDGEIFQLINDEFVAWHAGESYWNGKEKLNENSIGIELDNLGINYYPLKQMDSCISLCQKLINTYNIPTQNILGHSDIACSRKIDPGILFDWQYLSEHQLGRWHNIENLPRTSSTLFEFGDNSPKIFNLQKKLKESGYKIELTGFFDEQMNYVIRAFQAHFNSVLIQKLGMDFYWNNDSKYFWDENSERIINNLIKFV